MKNADSFYKWRAVIMNEPSRGDTDDRAARAAGAKHQGAARAPSQAAGIAASQVEPAPRSGTLVRGGASEGESSAMYLACNVPCSCCTSPSSYSHNARRALV